MANAARIADDAVAEVVTIPDGFTLDQCFHADAGFVACDNTVSVGMTYQNGTFGAAPTPEPIEISSDQALANTQAQGVHIVSSGTAAISGTWGTTLQDELNIIALQSGITASAPWLGYYRDKAGVKHTMTAPQFTALATAILGYVEALDEAYVTAVEGGSWSPPAQPVSIP